MAFQRDDNNEGTIQVAGIAYYTTKTFLNPQYLVTENPWSGSFTIEAKLEELNLETGNPVGGSPTIDWTSYSNTILTPAVINGRFLIEIDDVPSGWYKLSLRVKDNTGTVKATNEVSKVGIGDVFFIAGQSNAEGTSEVGGYNKGSDGSVETELSGFTYWDAVNSVNGAFDDQTGSLPSSCVITKLTKDTKIAPTGENAWCWGALGYLIANNEEVPVLFFNGARGGTPSRAWAESSESTTSPNPWLECYVSGGDYPDDLPYFNLRNGLSTYANTFGIRAVLWHQGETDTHFFYSSSCYNVYDYDDNLNDLIDNTRADFKESDLAWVVS